MSTEPNKEFERLSNELFAAGFHTRSIAERDKIAKWFLSHFIHRSDLLPKGMTAERLATTIELCNGDWDEYTTLSPDGQQSMSDAHAILAHLLAIREGEK